MSLTRGIAFVAIYRVDPLEVSKILSYRLKDGREQYLIRWRTECPAPKPAQAICSWHSLPELTDCLHLIQIYLETLQRSARSITTNGNHLPLPLKRKRKSPDDVSFSRDSGLGALDSPGLSHVNSRAGSASILSQSDRSDASPDNVNPTIIYNGVLERREGRLVAKRSKHVKFEQINATTLPTPAMVREAAVTPTPQTEQHIRLAFDRKLSKLHKLRLENNVDASTPSLNFKFTKGYVTGQGVYRADPEAVEGCEAPCKGSGCEWPRLCKCLEYAAINEEALRREDAERYLAYKQAKEDGEIPDTTDMPKRFPYHVAKDEFKPQTLVSFYREERYPIYECNPNCKCGRGCKSRVVQKGRKVPLTIFKTPNRGWGVYCDEDLIQGEFIDTYLGEIITNQEADRREQAGSKDKQSYLYSLDKFVNEDDLTTDNCYVVDGQYMGGPTRFINHCCEPNCRQYTVSYDKNNPRIYDIAFFAVANIPAGTELTFDYQDKDELEEDVAVRQREAAQMDPANAGKQPCNCGAVKCHGFLWE